MRTSILLGVALFLIVICIEIIGILNTHLHQTYLENVTAKGSKVLFSGEPKNYHANGHVTFKVALDVNSNYNITYQFKDHKRKIKTWKWTLPEKQTDAAILKFGIPKSMFEPYYPVDSVIRKRKRIMREGLFVQEGRRLKPDLLAMVKQYQSYLKPIAKHILETDDEYKSRRSKIELIMKFCQDIPYGVPPKNLNNKYIGGIFPPPQVFVNKFGDCDSKAVLFCAATGFLKNADLLILVETGHVTPAVKGIPKPYDDYYTHEGSKYILADTAGPGRNDLGMIKDPYKNFKKAIEIKID